jgi:hypothetical protein
MQPTPWLIAAAPELLQALERIYRLATVELIGDGREHYSDIAAVSRAAIAKARGESR